jgi:hypothetical protein
MRACDVVDPAERHGVIIRARLGATLRPSAAMPPLKIIWEDDALKLLMDRDRYTRFVIQEEFRQDPQKDAIALDAAEGDYLTQVSNKRFTVVWHLDTSRQQAIVRAVVPLTNIDAHADGLKEYVQRAVEREVKR